MLLSTFELSRPGHRFFCVNDGVPQETTTSLREACEREAVEYVEIDAPSFPYDLAARPGTGDILYRVAGTPAAFRVEQVLWARGVATFYADPERPFAEQRDPDLVLKEAGVPSPTTRLIATREREVIRRLLGETGGPPVIVKVPGGETGIGVMRADTLPGLFSLLDFLIDQGWSPKLITWVPDALHWRVVVVGDRAVAAYRNPTRPDDFRSGPGAVPDDYTVQVPAPLEVVSVAAVRALGLETGGVDVLASPDGSLHVLEVNFPCYHVQAEKADGVDVSGPMLRWLVAKAKRLRSEGVGG